MKLMILCLNLILSIILGFNLKTENYLDLIEFLLSLFNLFFFTVFTKTVYSK